MRLDIGYARELDVENYLRAAHSRNQTELSPVFQVYRARYGWPPRRAEVEYFVEQRLRENGSFVARGIEEVTRRWLPREAEIFHRLREVFGVELRQDRVRAYLTTLDRYSYNAHEGYFFVCSEPRRAMGIILHELFHLYTAQLAREMFAGRSQYHSEAWQTQYNILKESLTALINPIFGDVLDGFEDRGYPQHQALRGAILDWWQRGMSMDEIVDLGASWLEEHPEHVKNARMRLK